MPDRADDEEELSDQFGADQPEASPTVLYWWPPPVRRGKAKDVGRDMLFFTLTWFFTLLAIVIVVAIVLSNFG